jgi:site-specific recombinase XerD
MSEHANPRGDVDTDQSTNADHVRWTDHDLDDMQQLFWREIAPDAATDGIDVDDEKPTHDWLADNGYRPFVAALRRHHDLSFGEFWRQHIAPEHDTAYDWATTDPETRDALEHFLDRRETRYSLSEASIATLRYRLNTFARAFTAANTHGEIVASVARDGDTPAYQAVDEVFAAFDHLNEETDLADTTISRIAEITEAWYAHLVSRRVASTNPASGLESEFKWEPDDTDDTPALAPEHVRALYESADTAEDRLLVVALAAWGLRANEVAQLHVRQIDRDTADVPRLTFQERKNGPGAVSLLYGVDVLDERLAALSERDAWAGYLFPSDRSDAEHVARQTIWRRFSSLAADAGLPEEIDGERPSPQLARRFWYDRYSETLEGVIAGLEDVAAEQGSSDPEVVLRNYLSDDRARRLRRESMRAKLADVFDPDSDT